MSLALQPAIGAIAGWKLELAAVKDGPHALPALRSRTFSSEDYRGRVDASLVSHLAPGSYTIVVEDVAESDFKELREMAAGKELLQARLHLFWVDAPRLGPAADTLVAVLRVTSLRRRAGTWRYEMVVEGREWVYDRLMQYVPPVSARGPLALAAELAGKVVAVDAPRTPPPAPEPTAGDTVLWTEPGLTAAEQLRKLEQRIEEAALAEQPPRMRGQLGMFLIRDGKLLVGPDRIAEPKRRLKLDADGGLLDLQRAGAITEAGATVTIDTDPILTYRDLFTATLRGRPDLKPGDIVDLDAPERSAFGEDLGFALGPAPSVAPGTVVTAYVQEVNHRLSREQGFLTVVRCVAAAPVSAQRPTVVDRLWMSPRDSGGRAVTGSGESFVANMIGKVRDAVTAERWPDVAQVRALHLDTGDEIQPQRERLWRGIGPADGQPFGAARLPFAKVRKELTAAPYLTPFAYGNCGLVLPRYPGMRVMVVNRGGDTDDPVEAGALWGEGGAPPSEVGDWSLTLPVDLDARAALPDSQEDGDQWAERATKDLIDGKGNRVIEVGKLTIRIGKDQLTEPHARPQVADEPVTIEHAGGKARIVIAQDGSVTIESVKTLTLKGNDGINLETGGNVTITAGGNVDVKKGS